MEAITYVMAANILSAHYVQLSKKLSLLKMDVHYNYPTIRRFVRFHLYC